MLIVLCVSMYASQSIYICVCMYTYIHIYKIGAVIENGHSKVKAPYIHKICTCTYVYGIFI